MSKPPFVKLVTPKGATVAGSEKKNYGNCPIQNAQK